MNLFPRLSSATDFDHFVDHFFAPVGTERNSFFSPKVDIKEYDTSYQILAEMPGVNRNDVNLDIHDGVLTLSAELKQEDKVETEGKVIRQERRYGKFQRSFNVGDKIHVGDITAHFEDGVLKITLPKVKTEKSQQHRITIN